MHHVLILFAPFFRKLWKLLLFSCLHDYHRLSLANFTETPQSWIARITGPILHFCCELSGLAQVFFIFFILLTSFGLMLGPWSVIPDLDMSETALCVRTYLNTCIYIYTIDYAHTWSFMLLYHIYLDIYHKSVLLYFIRALQYRGWTSQPHAAICPRKSRIWARAEDLKHTICNTLQAEASLNKKNFPVKKRLWKACL